MNIRLNSDSAAGLPPAAKNALAGETDLDKVKPAPPAPTPPPVTPPTPAPAPVKDEKWLETEIAHAEDKLRQLRSQKQTAAPPPAKPARKKTGWECEDLA